MSAHRSGFVALLGVANAGKSTLLNQYVGAKAAIVTPKPQTTRHRILGIRTEPGRQFVFVDTPGIHAPRTKMGEHMVQKAWSAAKDADVVVILQDVLRPLAGAQEALLKQARETLRALPRIHALNKIDAIRKHELLPRLDETQRLDPEAKAFVPISALKGENLDRLLDAIAEHLPEQPALYPEDWWTDQSQEQLAAEYVREKVFMQLREEVPFQTAVVVERFEPVEDGSIEIDATILVAKRSHKPIVLGKAGARIKAIGIAARRELEALFGRHVRLNLWVKVSPKWFEREGVLRELGI
ncbi:MAG: GTPase Era [Zetaproteobacteria bacterium]|nr:MAG: GTPase Era [Zetaproteobacteria bacterium]